MVKISGFIITALPAVLFLCGTAAAVVALLVWSRRVRHRKNPLTVTLLRAPGHSMQIQLEDLNWDIGALMFLLGFAPVMVGFIHLAESYLAGMPETVTRAVVNLIAMVGLTAYLIRQLLAKVAKRADLRLGYDAERATGQELQRLAPRGYRIYHDIPAAGFNIDHVVVGPTGVYAVETKGRSKRHDQPGQDSSKVTYDGEALRFPGWIESNPIRQAKDNAAWLANELCRAVGESVKVKPVLSICGWYVQRESKSPPIVYNGKNPEAVFPKIVVQPLTDQTIERICYQLEQWVGDVEPAAYRQTPN